MNLTDKYLLEKQYKESIMEYGCKDNLSFHLLNGNEECNINKLKHLDGYSVEKSCKACMKEILDKNDLKNVLLSLMNVIKYSNEYNELAKVLGYCPNCKEDKWLCCTEDKIKQIKKDLLLITGEKLC